MARKISLGIAIIYLILALIFGGGQLFLIAIIAFIWPVAMIWFGQAIGDYLGGFHRIGRPYITKKSPGSLVSLFGWIFLMAPAIIILIKLL